MFMGAVAPVARSAPGACLQPQPQRWPCAAAAPVLRQPLLAPRRGRRCVCEALENYMVDKLRAAEGTFRELQLRMADPDVASNAAEFQKASPALPCLATALRCPCIAL
jgi:hypothetical protein